MQLKTIPPDIHHTTDFQSDHPLSHTEPAPKPFTPSHPAVHAAFRVKEVLHRSFTGCFTGDFRSFYVHLSLKWFFLKSGHFQKSKAYFLKSKAYFFQSKPSFWKSLPWKNRVRPGISSCLKNALQKGHRGHWRLIVATFLSDLFGSEMNATGAWMDWECVREGVNGVNLMASHCSLLRIRMLEYPVKGWK